MKRNIGIMVHRSKPEALTFAGEIVAWLEKRGVPALLDGEAARKLARPEASCDLNEAMDTLRLLVTLGGDGLILQAAQAAAPLGVPILGVHMGRFGFIAETDPDSFFLHLSAVLDGEVRIEDRLMIQAEIHRGGDCFRSRIGLNEAVVKSGASHLLRLRTRLGTVDFATYPADGLIVATPTGSTAYSLSAGGPLVEPTIQALILTPICPHTLSARPMLVPSDETIEIEVESDGDELIFSVDGMDPVELHNGDRVVVRRAEPVTRLISLDKAGFYRKVRARYLYGERLNA